MLNGTAVDAGIGSVLWISDASHFAPQTRML
jgi:hypothetical protein